MEDYTFIIFSDRFQANRTYNIRWLATGWHISHVVINGNCSPDGKPYLYENFNQDGIHYPTNLDGFMENIWNRLKEGSINDLVAQQRLQQLADWVSISEQSQPKWKGWNC